MPYMKHLGIDYGTKRVGIALSDEAGVMGFPHATLPNDPLLLETVKNLVALERVGAIVMGESLNFKGEENPVAKEARAFAQVLEEETGLTVFYEPEMLTTQEARRDFEGARTKGAVDASAAALILTSFLDKRKSNDQLR